MIRILTFEVNENGAIYIEVCSEKCPRPMAVVDGNRVEFVRTERRYAPDGKSENLIVYEAEMPIDDSTDFFVICGCKKCPSKPFLLHTEHFSYLANISGAYTEKRNVYIQKRRRKVVIYRKKPRNHILLESIFLARVLFNWRIDAVIAAFSRQKRNALSPLRAVYILLESLVMMPRTYILRAVYFARIREKERPIWIISDRGSAAGDNGEAFYRYCLAHSDQSDRDVYFAVSKKSKDFERIRQLGPVLNYGSLRYKLMFLMADFIISSQADIEVINPFLRQRAQFVDLFSFRFVFLQHGIIRNDLSDWLNRYKRNISLFITSSSIERASILDYPYYYPPSKVLLSGLPRYDELHSNPHKKIIIAPTYRASLLRTGTNLRGERRYDGVFKESDFFSFYNKLINDRRLLDVMKQEGYVGEFLLHPVFIAQLKDFSFNDIFSAPAYPYSYKTSFEEGALLISDYSSVTLDFAYLKKPVIYAKFDEKHFYNSHTYKKGDFFSDEKDGFGEVTHSYDELINTVVEAIIKGCKMDPVYKRRVDTFFYKRDKNNSARVYKAVLEMEKRI